MDAQALRYPPYRWVVLGAACLVGMSVTISWWVIPSLAYRLFPDLGLSHMQYTLIFTGPFLLAIAFSMVGGAMGDRFGIRRMVAIGVFLAGGIGLARAFAPSFGWMFALMCLFGVHLSLVVPNLPKLVSIWFPPHQTGLASGVYFAAIGVGASLGLLTGPLFGSWRTAFVFTGILIMLIGVIWAVIGRDSPPGVQIRTPPLLSGIRRGLGSRNVWLLAIGLLFTNGVMPAFLGNLADALEGVHNVNPEMAGAIASFLAWGTVLGHGCLPALSDRVGLRKPFICGGAIGAAACFFFGWRLAPDVGAWILIFVGGVVWGGLAPTLYACLVRLPEIGHEHVGGAAGFMGTFGYLGGFCIPTFAVSSIVASGTLGAYTTGFLVAALMLAAVALPVLLVTETGARAVGAEVTDSE